MPPSRWGPQRCRRSPIAHLCPFARSLHGLLWALYTMWAPALLPQTAAALRAQACSECASAGEGGGKLVDFGPDGFHDEALEVQLPAFQCWLPYGPVYPWKKQLANKLRLVEWCRTHPGVGAVDLKRPLWVVGLPRTGSTIFHKLMAVRPPVHQSTSPPVHHSTSLPLHRSNPSCQPYSCPHPRPLAAEVAVLSLSQLDPNARSIRAWELRHPLPPTPSNAWHTDLRLKKFEEGGTHLFGECLGFCTCSALHPIAACGTTVV